MGDVDPKILLLYRSLDLGGVLLMGILGGTIARQRHFDVVGFIFQPLFSSLGGGMIRDALIGRGRSRSSWRSRSPGRSSPG